MKDQCCQAVRSISGCAAPGFDDPTAQHPVPLVKDRRLPRAEGPLGRVKLDAQPPVRQRPDRGRYLRACVADLDLGANRFGQPIHAQEVKIANEARALQQILLRTYNHGIAGAVHAHDIEALRRRESKPAPLARSIERHPAMSAQHRPIRADERPWPRGLRGLLLQETAIVALCHEADLLALLNLVSRQPDRFRLGPYVLLAQAADGKEDARQPCSVQAVQEIALVLSGIPSLVQVWPPRAAR